MFVERNHLAVDQPHAFPDAVTKHEAGIEDGDFGLVALEEFAVHIDQDIVIAIVLHVSLRARLTG